MDGDAPDLLVVRRVIRERPEEGVGLLLREDGMKLAVDRPPLFMVEGILAFLDQPIDLEVRVADKVVLVRADLSGMKERRDVRRIIEHQRSKDNIKVMFEENIFLPCLPLLEFDLDIHADVL